MFQEGVLGSKTAGLSTLPRSLTIEYWVSYLEKDTLDIVCQQNSDPCSFRGDLFAFVALFWLQRGKLSSLVKKQPLRECLYSDRSAKPMDSS
jgi:hypothetical protein